MRLLVTGLLVVGAAIVASGCDGGAGPVTPPFSPFGTDPSGSTTEPAGGSNEPASGGGGSQTIAQLCATDCARAAATCPTSGASDCVSSCGAVPAMYPGCVPQIQAYFACIATASLTCSSSGSVDATGCMNAEQLVLDCIGSGTSVTSTGGTS
jgi:hypothetical protein